MPADTDTTFHLENGLVAAYLDGRLGPEERAKVEGHLADCPTCRREIVAVARLRRSATRRPRWMIAVPAVAAAAVVLFLSWPGAREESVGRGPVVRGGGEEGVAAVAALAPAAGAVVPREALTFTWRPAGPETHYRLTVTDDQGNVVWTAATDDTTLTARPLLVAARVYYWYVDALLPDGRSATSGAQELRTAP